MTWSIHHVNLPAHDVRESARFFTDVLGLPEGPWEFPAGRRGAVPDDPARLTSLPSGPRNAGLHLIKPDPFFAERNGMRHNPSIGGHVAITVPDLDAVMRRLDAAGVPFSYAPTYAIEGMRHIYLYDPSMNLLEINEMTDGRRP